MTRLFPHHAADAVLPLALLDFARPAGAADIRWPWRAVHPNPTGEKTQILLQTTRVVFFSQGAR